MPVYCAIPPLDQAATRIGRGYGLGYNRARTRVDQMHAGFDFVADRGTPVIAPVPGTVVAKAEDSSTARQFRGYGNAVVLEHRFDVPGIPNPFYTLYAHLRDPVALPIGTRVGTGTLLGYIGNTTNGQFAGMGPHLHFEVRRAPVVAYGSPRDTFDPAILWRAMGIDWLGAHREAERMVGGQLLVREGGPSDCRAGIAPTIAGLAAQFGDAPRGYVDPAQFRSRYAPHGTSRSNADIAAQAYHPPDYASVNQNVSPSGTPLTTTSGVGVALGVGVGVLGLWILSRR